MGFLRIQGGSGSASASTIPITVSPTVQYNLVVVNIKVGATSETISSVTDNVGNTYAKAAGPRNNSISGLQYYGVQITGGATTITVTKSGAVNSCRVEADEFSGGATTNAAVFDKAATEALNSTNGGLVTPLAPTSVGELIVSGLGWATGPTGITAATGYTLGVSNVSAASQYKLSGGASETAAMTWTGSTQWVNVVAAYIPRSNNAGFMAFT